MTRSKADRIRRALSDAISGIHSTLHYPGVTPEQRLRDMANIVWLEQAKYYPDRWATDAGMMDIGDILDTMKKDFGN